MIALVERYWSALPPRTDLNQSPLIHDDCVEVGASILISTETETAGRHEVPDPLHFNRTQSSLKLWQRWYHKIIKSGRHNEAVQSYPMPSVNVNSQNRLEMLTAVEISVEGLEDLNVLQSCINLRKLHLNVNKLHSLQV